MAPQRSYQANQQTRVIVSVIGLILRLPEQNDTILDEYLHPDYRRSLFHSTSPSTWIAHGLHIGFAAQRPMGTAAGTITLFESRALHRFRIERQQGHREIPV